MNDDILDLPEVLERVQDDWELLLELIEIFLEDCPQKLLALKSAAENKDFNQIKEVSHALKGSSANLAAKRINALFIQIENMGKSQDVTGFPETLQQAQGEIERLRGYLVELKKQKKT